MLAAVPTLARKFLVPDDSGDGGGGGSGDADEEGGGAGDDPLELRFHNGSSIDYSPLRLLDTFGVLSLPEARQTLEVAPDGAAWRRSSVPTRLLFDSMHAAPMRLDHALGNELLLQLFPSAGSSPAP